MAENDVELVRRAFRLMSRGADPEAISRLADVWHPEIEYREDPLFPGSSEYHGLAAVTARFGEYLEVLGSPVIEVQSIEVGDSAVLALWTITGETDRGVPFEQPWAWVMRTRDGLIDEVQAHLDRDMARSAAGVA